MRRLFDYIRKDSPQNAAKVLEEIVKMAEKAVANPERYGPDKYKIDNDGSYRAFEKYHYRVAYRFQENTIRILRVAHTAREPKTY